MTLILPNTILEPLNAHIRSYGVDDAEAGAFLLGPYSQPIADVLVFAEGVGVERSRGLFRVSGKAVEQLFAWADEHDLRVWGQVHSHPRGSFLSDTDETYGFRVRGFLSAVVPNYANPPDRPEDWGWWTFDGAAWVEAEAAAVAVADARIYRFDETGVR
jgi:proteasome lid subunit RPN8/RPN11